MERDLRDNKAMGKFGAEAILKGIAQKAVALSVANCVHNRYFSSAERARQPKAALRA